MPQDLTGTVTLDRIQDAALNPGDDAEEHMLFSYACLRADLGMLPGKLASQACHASRLSLLSFIKQNPHRLDGFISDSSCGSIVILLCRDLRDLQRVYREAMAAGLPCSFFSDSGHVLLPHFNGSEVATGVGIGPCLKASARPITKRLRMA